MSSYESDTSERIVTARKPHRCEGCRCESGRMIAKGEDYTRAVCFPGHEANGGTRPWVLKLCSQCKPIVGVRAERTEQ